MLSPALGDKKAYHLEEQRNMSESDLYRFAAQHFTAAKEWRDDIVDIILISGQSYNGKKAIKKLEQKGKTRTFELNLYLLI